MPVEAARVDGSDDATIIIREQLVLDGDSDPTDFMSAQSFPASDPPSMQPDTSAWSRESFDRFRVAVLDALYALDQAGRSPSNEEDLEEKLGYSNGAAFRRDRPLVEDVLTDLQLRAWVEIDPR